MQEQSSPAWIDSQGNRLYELDCAVRFICNYINIYLREHFSECNSNYARVDFHVNPHKREYWLVGVDKFKWEYHIINVLELTNYCQKVPQTAEYFDIVNLMGWSYARV